MSIHAITYSFEMQPDMAAPGVSILAAHRNPADADDASVFMSGTSMACPHVTGIVALIKSIHQDWSPAAIKSALITTGHTLSLCMHCYFLSNNVHIMIKTFSLGVSNLQPLKLARMEG